MQAKFSPLEHRIWILDHEISLFAQYIFKSLNLRNMKSGHIISPTFHSSEQILLFENISDLKYQEPASQNRQVCALFF